MGAELVGEARHHVGAVGVERPQRRPHDRPDRREAARDGRLPGADDVEELGLHRPGAERQDADAAAPVLLAQREAEVEHEGLRGTVDGEVRGGLEARRGGHVDHRTPAAREHAGQQLVGEVDEGDHVDHQLVVVALPVDGLERAAGAEAGVVDQEVHGEAPVGEFGADTAGGVGSGEVLDQDVGGDAVGLAEALGEVVQAVGGAGDQDEVVAARGELGGELGAEAGGRAGDQSSGGSAHGGAPLSIDP